MVALLQIIFTTATLWSAFIVYTLVDRGFLPEWYRYITFGVFCGVTFAIAYWADRVRSEF